MYWIHKKDSKYVSRLAKFGYYLGIGLLLFTFFFGTKVNDAGRWIRIPFVGLTFQSSDFAKLALIVVVSKLLVRKKELMDNWREGFWPVMIPIFVICGLIVKDNFSTAAITFFICLVLLFVARAPFGKIAIVLGVAVVFLGLVISIHKAVPALNLLPRYDTWENRILNKMNDSDENVLANAQALNAQLAIYSGSIFGQGVGDGKLKEYLPEAYADFYYSSFVEEFGSVSAIILVFLYLILLFRVFKVGFASDNLFETYVCVGIGVLLLMQASVNICS